MKRAKTFATIVYYLFTIMIGILMCIFLPYFLLYDGESMNMMEDALESGDPASAMAFVGGYFNSEPVFARDFENGASRVVFESATLYTHKYEAENDEEQQTAQRMHKAYYGFVYGLDGKFDAYQEQDNKTVLEITTATGKVNFQILDSDSNKDGVLDHIAILRKNDFFVLEMGQDDLAKLDVTSMSKLAIYDKDGNLFAEVQLPAEVFGEEQLFNTEFFADVDSFVAKYNELIDFEVTRPDDENFDTITKGFAQEMSVLDQQILEKGHSKSSTTIAQTRADKVATAIIVIYFIAILVIGDFLLGPRYILRFFKWFLVKVCKVAPEKLEFRRNNKASKNEETTFGNDYFCQVRFELNETEREGLDDQIIVAYASEKQNVVFTLNKDNRYSDLQRVQKDVLQLVSVESLNSLTYDEIPDSLEVSGFNKSIIIKKMLQEE